MSTSPKPPYSQEHVGLIKLIRLYALAGDSNGPQKGQRQDKIASAMKKVRWDLSKDISRVLGLFAGLEWFELIGEYLRAMRTLAEAGDSDLPDNYREGLNTLLANRDKRLQFIKERLKPTPEEYEQLSGCLTADIVDTSGYIRCRDTGLGDDELHHWEYVKNANTQIGVTMDALLSRKRDENVEAG